MFRILTLALAVAFASTIAPALAQGTGGSPGKMLKKPMTTSHTSKTKTKAKKGHKVVKKGKKSSGGGTTQPPK